MKGFTLIELLAVIVILSIVLLISTAIIGPVIENVRLSSFESSSKGILNATKNRVLEKKLNNTSISESITYEDGAIVSGTELSYNGKTPKNGTIIIKENGNILMVLFDGSYCSTKNEHSDEINVVESTEEECTIDLLFKLPLASIVLTPTEDILTTTELDFSGTYQLYNGATFVEEEWQNKNSFYPVGNHMVRYRVKDSNEAWSQWSEISFSVHNETDIKRVIGGWHYSFAITYGGRIKVTGGNGAGQLGTGNYNDSRSFIQTSPTNLKNADAQLHEAFGLRKDGSVYVWGYNTTGQLGMGNTSLITNPTINANLSNVKEVVSGTHHAAALLNDGTVKIWGTNFFGELGLGLANNATMYTPQNLTGISNVKKIGLGDKYSVLLMNDGTLKTFGYNNFGQLGLGNTTNSNTPVTVPNISNVKDIFVGGTFVFALLNDGTVKAWGNNTYGQLGIGNLITQTSPVVVPGLSDVKQIAPADTDGSFTLALLNDGTVKSFGLNNRGQLGMGTIIDLTTPTLIPNLNDVVYIAVGSSHSLVICKNNIIKTWGWNGYGQLGTGDLLDKHIPTTITIN